MLVYLPMPWMRAALKKYAEQTTFRTTSQLFPQDTCGIFCAFMISRIWFRTFRTRASERACR